MPASIVPSASPELLAFTYDGDASPSGVLDARIARWVIGLVLALEPDVRRSLDSIARRMDCLFAAPAWERALRAQGVEARLVGGVGVDEDEFTSDYQTVPLESRSGYRESDGHVHRHFWLLIGTKQQLFDPTAHQFDAKGGVTLNRYVIRGRPLALPTAGLAQPKPATRIARDQRPTDARPDPPRGRVQEHRLLEGPAARNPWRSARA